MTVYKFLQDNKHHLDKVKDNIDTHKTIIAKEITDLVEDIQIKLQDIKKDLFAKLD